MKTCGEVLVELLDGYGIDTVFGIPGVHTVELYRGLDNCKLRHVTPRHEQGAGFMADGFFRSSGRVAACFIITGPGMTNIVTAMGQALADSIPMLVISSVNHTYKLAMGHGELHELPNQRNLISGVSRFSHTLMRPDELPELLARAFAIFNCDRPGPVHIEIPIDVITAKANHIDIKIPSRPYAPSASAAAIEAAIELLKTAKRPLIIVGGGAVNASDELIGVAEKLDSPVVNTVNAKGVIPYSHPLAIGGSPSSTIVRDEIRDADVVLAVGTEFGETDFDYFYLGGTVRNGKLIRVDIDSAQLTRNQKADVAICSDATLALQMLQQRMSDNFGKDTDGVGRAKNMRVLLKESRNSGYESFFSVIRSALPDVIIAGDSTQPVYYAWQHYETEFPRAYFHSASGFGTLGYAIPSAIGAKLANPSRPVIGLIGDGAVQFTAGELASAAELGVPVIFLVWNNHGYGEIKRAMINGNLPQIGVDIHTPDFLGLGKAMGCESVRAQNLGQLETELQLASTRQGPSLIEVRQEDFADGYV
jgi:acetolactate synthase I/II/III large subunit